MNYSKKLNGKRMCPLFDNIVKKFKIDTILNHIGAHRRRCPAIPRCEHRCRPAEGIGELALASCGARPCRIGVTQWWRGTTSRVGRGPTCELLVETSVLPASLLSSVTWGSGEGVVEDDVLGNATGVARSILRALHT